MIKYRTIWDAWHKTVWGPFMWSVASGTQSFLLLFHFHLSICQSIQVVLYYSPMFTAQLETHTHTHTPKEKGGRGRVALHTNTNVYCCNPIRQGLLASCVLWEVKIHCVWTWRGKRREYFALQIPGCWIKTITTVYAKKEKPFMVLLSFCALFMTTHFNFSANTSFSTDAEYNVVFNTFSTFSSIYKNMLYQSVSVTCIRWYSSIDGRQKLWSYIAEW